MVTVIALAKGVNALFERHYSVAFHAIVGIVIAATIMIIPVSSFITLSSVVINLVCFGIGFVCALLLDKFNSSVSK